MRLAGRPRSSPKSIGPDGPVPRVHPGPSPSGCGGGPCAYPGFPLLKRPQSYLTQDVSLPAYHARMIVHPACPVLELRRYALVPGRRDELIELFEREFVESQEETGATLLGQFRDLDDPDRFVWIRGFPGMATRAESLAAFYGGPVWKQHARAANATMVDSDDVYLLRPVDPMWALRTPAEPRPPVGAPETASRVLVTIYHRDRPVDREFVDFFDGTVAAMLRDTGAEPLCYLQTEPAENTFPALPVREGENVFVWLAVFPSAAGVEAWQRRLEGDDGWREKVLPGLAARASRTELMTLAPTPRSLLR